MKYWTLQDEFGSIYPDEFQKWGDDEFTDDDAINANMDHETMQGFYDDGFKQVLVEVIVRGER